MKSRTGTAPAKTARKAKSPTTARPVRGSAAKAARVLKATARTLDPGEEEIEEEAPPQKRRGYLVVVESPAKAKTIKKYLGRQYSVKASVGHVKDLPKSKMGVDPEHGFAPTYEVIKGKAKGSFGHQEGGRRSRANLSGHWTPIAKERQLPGTLLRRWAAQASTSNACSSTRSPRRRFQEAIKHPLELDRRKFDSQQARRSSLRSAGRLPGFRRSSGRRFAAVSPPAASNR